MAKRIQILITSIFFCAALACIFPRAVASETVSDQTEADDWQEIIEGTYQTNKTEYNRNYYGKLRTIQPAGKSGAALFDRKYATKFIFTPRLGQGYDFVFRTEGDIVIAGMRDFPCPKAEGFSRIKKYTWDAKAFCRKGGSYNLDPTEIIDLSESSLYPASAMPDSDIPLDITAVRIHIHGDQPCTYSHIIYSVKVLDVYPGKDSRVCIAELVPS